MSLILALETASTACSAALCRADGSVLAESLSLEGPAHAQRLLPGVAEVFAATGADWGDVGAIAVGLGPGAFTGLRIGVATARALAQADAHVRLLGVPTTVALALALAESPESCSAAPRQLRLVPLIDGRRREVFAAVCSSPAPGALAVVTEVAVIKAGDLGVWLEALGPSLVGGDGAVLYAAELPPAARLAAAVTAPTAAMVGRAVALGVPGVVSGPDAVLPLYGRAPDAARWIPLPVALP